VSAIPSGRGITYQTLEIGLLVFCCCAVPAVGQNPQSDQAHQANDCRLAQQVLTLGQPANKHAWAVRVIGNCGAAGGQTLATVLLRHRADQAPSPEFEALVESASLVRDRCLFERALAIASDADAGSAARVESIRILYHLLNPATLAPYAMFVEAPNAERHAMPLVSSTGDSEGDPLPTDALAQVVSSMAVVRSDAGAPEEVRRAASVLWLDARDTVLRAQLCPTNPDSAACDEVIERWFEEHPES
jgi:hypothetical protein